MKQTLLFLILLIVVALFAIFWKSWGEPVFSILLAIQFFRMSVLFRTKLRMNYLSVCWAFFVLVCLGLLIKSIMRLENDWLDFTLMFSPLFFLVMQGIERKKNPDKMRKWKAAFNGASFFEFLSLKYIQGPENLKKPKK